MVIHACVLSQALFSTELHWRTKIVRFGDHVGALVLQLADLRRLSLGHTWLYSALTRYDSSSALFDATPACPHTLSGPVLHTYVSDSSTQSPDALFSIVLKPPAGVFRPPTGVFSTTERLPTGYHRLPTGYRRLPTSYRRLPNGYRRLPTGYRRLPTGYRRLPTDYRRLPPATDRLPTGYLRLPPATVRLPPVQKKKKKKKNSFLSPEECHSCSLQTEFPIWRLGDADRAQKIFGTRAAKWGLYVCLSIYIYGH